MNQAENPFGALFRVGSVPLIRRTLLAPGTWLDDEVVLQLFYFMAWRKRHTAAHVCLVDSCVAESVLRGSGQARHLRASFESGAPLVLLPLVCGSHWSLLIWRARAWYHADSLAPFHARLAHATLERLDALGIVARQPGARLRSLALPRQRGGWECGLYVLQYALGAIAASKRAGDDERRFVRELRDYCELACGENRLLFTAALLREL